MELNETINALNFPPQYQTHIDKVNLTKANDFVKAMLNSIVQKYGRENVKREIHLDNSNSKVSIHLTHIIEVGGLKIISDNDLLVNETQEFKNMIVGVVFLLNCSLATELNNLNLYSGSKSNYYNNDAIILIASRLANHTIKGKNYSNGLEYYANQMIFNNLISEFNVA